MVLIATASKSSYFELNLAQSVFGSPSDSLVMSNGPLGHCSQML